MLDLNVLNLRQREAVLSHLGPVLVSAGAGSGKTKVLSYRIAYLIEQGLVSGGEILALTFTNKAAKEMQERVWKLLNNLPENSGRMIFPTMGTFHGVGVKILRQFGEAINIPKNFTIFDSDDSLRLIKRIVKELEVPENFSPTLLAHMIGQAKNNLETPETWAPDVAPSFTPKVLAVFRHYEQELRNSKAVDFDDLLILPIKLWREHPNILTTCQLKYNYILVDEYQDTNSAQYEWLKILRPDGRIFAVGDDAQSIYGFRGSNLANWKKFQQDFAGCVVIHLEQNYRSTQNILDASGKVLAMSGMGHKELWTDSGRGEMVKVHELADDTAESEFVVKTVARLAGGRTNSEADYETEEPETGSLGGGLLDRYLAVAKQTAGRGRVSGFALRGLSTGLDRDKLSDIAILYRTHGQSRALEEAFIASGIPYRIVGGVKFYQRKEIKDVLSVLRLILNPGDILALERLVDVLPLGIGDKSFPHLVNALQQNNNFDAATVLVVEAPMLPKQKNGAIKLLGTLSALTQTEEEKNTAELLQSIIHQLDFQKILRDGTDQGEARWENLQELVSVAVSRLAEKPWREGALELLEEAALLAETAQDEAGGAVQMMSIHAAKGLEFDTVFVTGWEEGVLPHSRALFKDSELEEEVRLAYVAMTRARRRLILTFTRGRMLGGGFRSGVPSRFLRGLPKEGVEWVGGRQRSINLPESSGRVSYVPFEDSF